MTGNLDITELIKIADSSEPNVRTRIHRAAIGIYKNRYFTVFLP